MSTDVATTSTTDSKPSRQRVPASERRDALIDAAIHEFAQTGFHGTPVDRIARRVGVAQPYVFSLFGSKRELFLAAVERCFAQVTELMTSSAAEFDPAIALPDTDQLTAMGDAYVKMLATNRDCLMLQLQAYAACDDEVIRDRVRACTPGWSTTSSADRRRPGADRRLLPLRHVAQRHRRDGRQRPLGRLRVDPRRSARGPAAPPDFLGLISVVRARASAAIGRERLR